jgi:outer membrane protein OmpA-like peptidoglycan-associated protein
MKKNLSFGILNLFLFFVVQFIYPSEAVGKDIKPSIFKKLFNEHLSIGINSGKSNYVGDLNNNSRWNSHFERSISGVIGYQISPVFGVRIQYINGSLSTTSENEYHKALSAKYWDCGYQVIVNLNNLISNFNPNRFLNLYIFSGPSLVSYHSIVKNKDESRFRETVGRTNELLVILGAGASMRLHRNLDLNIEYANHLSTSDDRLDFNDQLKKKDKFSYASVGLTYKFMGSDKDKDGMIDKRDLCPEILGKVEHDGCPDKDNDGIADKDDVCVDIAGIPQFKGCPDTDNDGITDNEDLCPSLAGPKEQNGCPDKDGDGIADKDDKCPDIIGTVELIGCPDKDNDGVSDIEDRCPHIAGFIGLFGCPDRDMDGTADNDDQCPDLNGLVANKGCPMESESMVNKVIYFKNGKTNINSVYSKGLEEISEIMKSNPNVKIIIEGHADSFGSENYNYMISEKRAANVMDYLTSKGIDKNRITFKSFGETKPAVDNKTRDGRNKNRRVEIKTNK